MLTIGMAVYDDFDGVYFTIQSLQLYHKEVMDRVEFIVVDNNPDSERGKTTEAFLRGWIKNARYVPYTEIIGTAAPRDQVFKLASHPYVMVVDPHILLVPGSLAKLIKYYEENPSTCDLLSGPLLYDDGESIATHFKDEWRGGMWGTWDTDQRGIVATSPPFEIPAMGLGLFTCRKECWPGFNPNFRRFGGEEFYIHEKFRQLGRKALCLPFLRWQHRFGRPGGAPYPLTTWHKARNYYLGHKELGLDLSPVYEHFVQSGTITQDEWQLIIDGKENNMSCNCGGSYNRPDVVSNQGQVLSNPLTLEEHYNNAKNNKSDINEHVEWIRELSEGKEHVVVFGGHHNISTLAVIAGGPDKLTVVDKAEPTTYSYLLNWKNDVNFYFIRGDDRYVKLEKVDLIFIDSVHTAEHVYTQLVNVKDQTDRILLHDTEIYGEIGEDGGPGIMVALRRFLKENNNWTVVEHRVNNHGMTLISRLDSDKKVLPSLAEMSWNFAKTKVRDLLNGQKRVPLPVAESRLAECWICPLRNGSNCSQCGCFLDEMPNGNDGKVWYASESCPIGKWHKEE